MAATAQAQVMAIAGALKRAPVFGFVSDDERKARIETCISCPSAVDTLSLCLECGCNFIRGSRFRAWRCKKGKF